MMHRSKSTLVAAVLASGVSLAACSSDSPSQVAAEEGPASSTESADVKRFVRLFNGYSADYTPFETPEEMAKASQLIVGGNISGVVEGRTWYPGAGDESQTVFVQLEVDEIYQGSLPPESGQQVSVEVKSGAIPAESFDKNVPTQSRTLLYLIPAPETGEGYGQISEPILESQVGEPLWVPVNPQGFMIDVGHDGVAVPIDLEIHADDTLGEYVPPFDEN